MIKYLLRRSTNLQTVTDPEPDPLIPPVVSAAEAGRILNLTRAMVSVLANNGRLKGRRIDGSGAWIFRRDAVEAYKRGIKPKPSGTN